MRLDGALRWREPPLELGEGRVTAPSQPRHGDATIAAGLDEYTLYGRAAAAPVISSQPIVDLGRTPLANSLAELGDDRPTTVFPLALSAAPRAAGAARTDCAAGAPIFRLSLLFVILGRPGQARRCPGRRAHRAGGAGGDQPGH